MKNNIEKKSEKSSRRGFLKSAMLIPAMAIAPNITKASNHKKDYSETSKVPLRKFGKHECSVPIIAQGGMQTAHSPRFLEMSYREGIRYFDTAKAYINGQSERDFREWFKAFPQRREEIFLVTKDKKIETCLTMENVDERLENLGTDYIDLLFIHALPQNDEYKNAIKYLKSKEYDEQYKKIKASGKVKYIGFSCHSPTDIYLETASKLNNVDAIMFPYDPFMQKGSKLDKAIDACHKKGIALIAMKAMRAITKSAPKRTPITDKYNLSVAGAILNACWKDERICSVCCQMENDEQIRENVANAIDIKEDLKYEELLEIKSAIASLDHGLCTGCPSCLEYAKKYNAALFDVSRYVAYYEQDGNLEAKDWYNEMEKDSINFSHEELLMASQRCKNKVNYVEVFEKAKKYFS